MRPHGSGGRFGGGNMQRSEIERHLTLLAILHIVYSGIGVVAAGFIFLSMAGAGILSTSLSGEALPLAILGTISTVIGGFMMISFLPGLIGGIGLLRRCGWSRIVLLIVALLNLPAFPVGTGLGIYTLWLLWNPDNLRSSATA
jgi:hypothetical protein